MCASQKRADFYVNIMCFTSCTIVVRDTQKPCWEKKRDGNIDERDQSGQFFFVSTFEKTSNLSNSSQFSILLSRLVYNFFTQFFFSVRTAPADNWENLLARFWNKALFICVPMKNKKKKRCFLSTATHYVSDKYAVHRNTQLEYDVNTHTDRKPNEGKS